MQRGIVGSAIVGIMGRREGQKRPAIMTEKVPRKDEN